MRRQFARQIIFAIALVLSVSLCFAQASAQKRRNKRSRRVTNPVTVTPVQPTTTATEPQIISTADQQTNEQNNTPDASVQNNSRSTSRRRAAAVAAEPESEGDSMRRTVNDLSNQVTKLSDKLSQMEQQQRTLVDLERLSRAEQRAETLRAQLRDVQSKEADLEAHMEQVDFDLKPENIERSVAAYGSTHPEEARDARKRALENEKNRTKSQLDLMQTSRQRLESAIASADAEVESLRKRVDEATGETQTNAGSTENTNNTEGTTTEPTTPTTNNPPTSTTPPQPL
ncbi:MAG TPA: hypothetical protein VKB86_13460 [Pyrinomonadaceae bacterium]|nr:hypothetical protein [Pyrinomonadaceae bacterium]